ncbi:hypothetical protein SAMN02910353_03100 [Ruminococcus sp. YRD2003]|uniref:hypothetical protein n=1 Tax=Ruminococcus sp. YRD2003 TaxID=1452313 RepID=UPI0008C6CE3B|nr:hypothetical protein SAMN02910353_03100 [Ruminococcus flavefaciens]
MNFGESIAAFGTGYRKLLDKRTNKVLTKSDFCKYLLCRISKDEIVVLYSDGIEDKKHERGKDTFTSYYRNKDRRSLHPIAESIINSNNLDTSKFMSFLEDYCENYSKEKLLTNFKKYLPSASTSTLFDGITDEFVKILKGEESIPDNRRKGPASLNKADYAKESDDSLEAKMDRLLNTLIITGREIAEFTRTGVGDDVRYSRLMRKLKNDFKQLLALSELLHSSTSDDSSIYNEICTSVLSLEAKSFILTTHEFMIESVKNYHIHRLSELLRRVKEGKPICQ